MSRIRVYKNTRLGAAEIYPVYELDFSKLSALTGYTQQYSDDNVGSGVNKYRQWVCINNTVDTGIAGSIPRQENQSGNIIPFWHRYNNVINNRYYLDQENLESFAGVQQGVRPDDWGTNPNYVILSNETLTGINNFPGASGTTSVPINYPDLQWTTDTWNHQTAYYEDTKRSQLRKFFTETGRSFSVAKATYWNSNRYCGRAYCVGCFPTTSSNSYAGYNYTDENNSTYNRNYKLFYTYGITNIPNDADYYWDYWTGMTNIQMVFVHYVQDNTDFYGIALIQMNNLTEESEPVAIAVSAFDKDWWGESSIIAGGGGEGDWTRNGPPSVVQGGGGSFQYPVHQRQATPEDAQSWVEGHIAQYNNDLTTIYAGYNQYRIGKSPAERATLSVFLKALWDPNLWSSYQNAKMNPLSAIITCHLMPENLAPESSGVLDSIKALDRDFTTPATVETYTNPIKHYHVGSLDLKGIFDGFPDYENTNIFINLPYIGVYQLDTEALMDGQIDVEYVSDSYTGDCIAWIWVKDRFGNSNFKYLFKGNCAKPMYLASVVGAGAQRIGAITNAAYEGIAQGVTAWAAGNQIANSAISYYDEDEGWVNAQLTPTAAQAMNRNYIIGSAISSGVRNILNASTKATQGNASTGTVSVPIDTKCYLTITRPIWSAPDEYGRQFGYPSDISGTINQSDTEAGDPFTNFLSVRSIKLNGLSATDQEKAEIDTLMKVGVYVS